MVQKLAKSDEDRLLNALHKIADHTNDGTSPNDAIVKVASEMKIPHGQVQLLVNAYNIGRSTVQRESSDNVWEKAADFPIADIETILANMYPDDVKTASVQHNQTTISTEYLLPPSWLDKQSTLEKVASTISYEQPKPYERYENPYAKARDEINLEDISIKEAERRAWFVRDAAVETKAELVDYFKSANHIPFQEVKANAELMYGDSVKPLLDSLVSEEPRFAKQASKVKLSRAVGKPYELIKQCMNLADAYSQLTLDWQNKQAEAKSNEAEMMRPFEQPISRTGLPVSVLVGGQKAGSVYKQAAGMSSGGGATDPEQEFLTKTLGRGIGEGMKGKSNPFVTGLKGTHAFLNPKDRPFLSSIPSPSALLLGREGLFRPYHEGREDIRRQMITDAFTPSKPSLEPDIEHESNIGMLNQESTLSDLLSGDPVLSQRDPHEVLMAYSALRSMAPLAMNNKELLRTMLRKHLEAGQTDLFETELLTKIEKNLQQLQRDKSRGDDSD